MVVKLKRPIRAKNERRVNMGYGIKFRVWADYACFSRPELKVERVSYDVMTPSAAKGIIDSIYYKPSITWGIDKIHVINPIKFTNIRRNEVSETASFSKVKKIMKNPEPYSIVTNDVRQQRAALVLCDVEYVIEAHFEMTNKTRRRLTCVSFWGLFHFLCHYQYQSHLVEMFFRLEDPATLCKAGISQNRHFHRMAKKRSLMK